MIPTIASRAGSPNGTPQSAGATPNAPQMLLPRAPQSIEETGLGLSFLTELVGKVMFQHGVTKLTELAAHLGLGAGVVDAACAFLRRESLVEVLRRGQNDADVQYELTQAGRKRAMEWLMRSQYSGPAPVTLAAYTQQVQAQSVTQRRLAAHQVHEAFADLVVPGLLLDLLGTAVNSGRPMLLYGPAGSGKTYLAERLQRLLGGPVAIPHAICVHGEVIRVYDVQCHKPARAEAATPGMPGPDALDGRARADARWVLCERPVVVSGGELTLEMLDLSFDARAGYYEAPPHFKANNGLYIVDDLGRQVVTPRELMNRWIVPMERRHDHLMLHNGAKFTIPFDQVLVFSTNLLPTQLEDPAFLRRLGHKIAVDAVTPAEYRLIFQRACGDAGVPFDATAFELLLAGYHPRDGRALLACYPRDLLHLIASRATYLGVEPALSAPLLDWAWTAYFGTDPSGPLAQAGGHAAPSNCNTALQLETRSGV